MRTGILTPLILALVLVGFFFVRGRRSPATEEWEAQEPEFRAIETRLVEGDSTFLGNATRLRLTALLEDPATDAARRRSVAFRLARLQLKAGEVDSAIALFEEAFDAARGDPVEEARVLPHLALAHLRRAETENCVARHNAECCIFPLRGEGVHAQTEPAERARELYLEMLRRDPSNLEALWLVNIAAMALGEYPGGLPSDVAIPVSAFESEGRVGRFRDVAPELGVDTFNLCGGAAVDDFDGDGYLDILTSTYDPGEGLTLYRSRGDGSFEERSDESRASDQLGGLNLVASDWDGDGDPDVLVLRGAWLKEEGEIRNSLLRNDDGVFVDVSRAAGVAAPAAPTQAAAFGDFDGDGRVDLFVANESLARAEALADGAPGNYPDQLFLQRAGGRFEECARARGISGDSFTKGVCAGDFDNDGDLDLYLSNIGPNQLFENDGSGSFRDVAGVAGVLEPANRSFACWFFDYDNDGWLDLFVTAYDATVADLAAEALGRPSSAAVPRLYRNRGDGTFEDVARRVGIARPFKPMGANFGDIDNDGWLDVYLTTGEPMLQSLMPNVMLRNVEGKRFEDVTTAGGFGHLQKGHGVAFADIDQDGDQDIYHQLGGFFPVDRYHNALFENPGAGARWLTLTLVGRTANAAAIGARVRVSVETEDGLREIHRAVGSVSSFGGSPRRQEIGLGDARAIRSVEVLWPVTRKSRVDRGGYSRQQFENLELDATYRLTEGEPEAERIELRPFAFATRD